MSSPEVQRAAPDHARTYLYLPRAHSSPLPAPPHAHCVIRHDTHARTPGGSRLAGLPLSGEPQEARSWEPPAHARTPQRKLPGVLYGEGRGPCPFAEEISEAGRADAQARGSGRVGGRRVRRGDAGGMRHVDQSGSASANGRRDRRRQKKQLQCVQRAACSVHCGPVWFCACSSFVEIAVHSLSDLQTNRVSWKLGENVAMTHKLELLGGIGCHVDSPARTCAIESRPALKLYVGDGLGYGY